MLLILVVLLILAVLTTGPWYPYSRSWGYGPSGLIFILFVLLLLYVLFGRGRL